MPKSILEFRLPEEQDDFETACKANKLLCVLHDISMHLRNKEKYTDEETLNIAEFRQYFNGLLKDYEVDELV